MTADAVPTGPVWLSSVGGDIRTLRKRRSMTLAELASAVDRSVGFVSQIERGLSEPSLGDLHAIADTLGVPIGFFFENARLSAPGHVRHVVRSGERRRLGNPESGLVEELLSHDLGGAFEVVRCEFAPGARLDECRQRDTEEVGYVVSGVFEMEIGGIRHFLEAGDSFRLVGEPYRWCNPGDEATVLVWVISPPVY